MSGKSIICSNVSYLVQSKNKMKRKMPICACKRRDALDYTLYGPTQKWRRGIRLIPTTAFSEHLCYFRQFIDVSFVANERSQTRL